MNATTHRCSLGRGVRRVYGLCDCLVSVRCSTRGQQCGSRRFIYSQHLIGDSRAHVTGSLNEAVCDYFSLSSKVTESVVNLSLPAVLASTGFQCVVFVDGMNAFFALWFLGCMQLASASMLACGVHQKLPTYSSTFSGSTTSSNVQDRVTYILW